MKTQQTSLMMVLAGGHGGDVLLVVVAVLHPIVVQEFMLLVEGKDPISVIANRDVPLGI